MATPDDIKTRLSEFISENYPQQDISPGSALSQLVVNLQQGLLTNQYDVIDDLTISQGMDKIIQAPDDISDTAERIAANFDVYRKQGEKAYGSLKVEVQTSNAISLPQGSRFVQTQSGLGYLTGADQTWRINPGQGEFPLFKNATGYYFYASVTAEDSGTEYDAPYGATMTLDTDTANIYRFSSATVYQPITHSSNTETDGELVQRIKSQMTVRNYTSPQAIKQQIQDNFPYQLDTAVLGIFDWEVKRTKRNQLGIALPGMVDTYVRTTRGSYTEEHVLEGTQTSEQGVWEIFVNKDVCPGFDSVVSILPVNEDNSLGGTLVIRSIQYSFDNTSTTGKNFLTTQEDARRTQYQTAKILVEYPFFAGTKFQVTFLQQPGIQDIQKMFTDTDKRAIATDVLIKSVVPCFFSTKIVLVKKNISDTEESLNIAQLKQDIVNYINNVSFDQGIYVSEIIDICHNYDIERVDMPVTIYGDISLPSGSTFPIQNQDVLEIPDLQDFGISKQNTVFFVDNTGGTLDGIGIELI